MDSTATTLPSEDLGGGYFADRSWARRRQKALHFALTNPMAVVAAIFVIGFIAIAILADLLPLDPPLKTNPIIRLQGPSADHLFGTDSVGRDVLSRLIYGSRRTLYVAFAAVVVSSVVGTTIGLISGYFGGVVDALAQRVIETAQAFPALILAMLISSLVGPARQDFHLLILPLPVIILPVAVIFIPTVSRVVRASVLGTKNADFITAASTIGATPARILARHVLPNVSAPILVLASLEFGIAILVEASLSFIGLGTQAPNPSWGGMLATDGRKYLQDHPHLIIAPAAVISIVVLAVNILGDTVRDMLDPVLRNR